MMIYDVYYEDGSFDVGNLRLVGLKSAVARNTNGAEGAVLFDRHGKSWRREESVPAKRLTKAGRKLAETWRFTVAD